MSAGQQVQRKRGRTVHGRYSLDEIEVAFNASASGRVVGKLVVVPDKLTEKVV